MRKILLTAVLANGAALALLFAACKAPDGAGSARNAGPATNLNGPATNAAPGQAPKAQPPADVVRRVTPNELAGMIGRGEAVAVDVRGKNDYDASHIKGSISIPRNEVTARASELPKDKLVVFYCAWPTEQLSAGAALDIKPRGYENTAALLGGWAAWKSANLPTEGGK